MRDDSALCEAGCGRDFVISQEGEARPLPLCADCFLRWYGLRAA